jgi:hypothetical protein
MWRIVEITKNPAEIHVLPVEDDHDLMHLCRCGARIEVGVMANGMEVYFIVIHEEASEC